MVAVANYLPHTLVLLDAADLAPLEVIPAEDARRQAARASAPSTRRRPAASFVVALKDIPEIWEVVYGDGRAAGHRASSTATRQGMVEAVGAGASASRSAGSSCAEPLDDFFFDPDYRHLIGASRDGDRAVVVNLDVGREIAELPLPGLPHLGSGISWEQQGRRVMATPHLKEAAVSVIDTGELAGGQAHRDARARLLHAQPREQPYAWVDAFLGPHKDTVHVIDKRTLEIVRTLRPAPGKTAAHVEFTRDGRYALLSIWERTARSSSTTRATLEEVKRLPMAQAVGQVQRLEQDSWLRGHQPLSLPAAMSRSCCARTAPRRVGAAAEHAGGIARARAGSARSMPAPTRAGPAWSRRRGGPRRARSWLRPC